MDDYGKKKITEYDEKAIQEIHIWKSPKLSFFNKFVSKLSKPLDKIANKVPRKFSQNQVVDAIGKSVEGVIKVTNDASQWTVRPDSIMKEFNKRGYKLRTLKGIKRIKLEEIDKIVGWLDAKYKGIATLEGGTTGAAGLLFPYQTSCNSVILQNNPYRISYLFPVLLHIN